MLVCVFIGEADYFSTQGTCRGARFAFAFARGLPSNIAISVTTVVFVDKYIDSQMSLRVVDVWGDTR
jgi:hypothetical protein